MITSPFGSGTSISMENPLEVWVGALLHHPLGQRKNHLVDPEHDNAGHLAGSPLQECSDQRCR